MRKAFSYLSGMLSLALTLTVIAFSAAAIADTLGWRFNATGHAADANTPAITEIQSPNPERKRS